MSDAAILVGAAALTDHEGRVLMQQRPFGKEHGGLWEFPGGKLELGETPEQATAREIAEELALEIDPGALMPVGFGSAIQPSGRLIVMMLFLCRDWRGTPECRDAEAIGWFAPDALGGLQMPSLDIPLAAALLRAL
jgi:8-oxo-dGTP diphosphatase